MRSRKDIFVGLHNGNASGLITGRIGQCNRVLVHDADTFRHDYSIAIGPTFIIYRLAEMPLPVSKSLGKKCYLVCIVTGVHTVQFIDSDHISLDFLYDFGYKVNVLVHHGNVFVERAHIVGHYPECPVRLGIICLSFTSRFVFITAASPNIRIVRVLLGDAFASTGRNHNKNRQKNCKQFFHTRSHYFNFGSLPDRSHTLSGQPSVFAKEVIVEPAGAAIP